MWLSCSWRGNNYRITEKTFTELYGEGFFCFVYVLLLVRVGERYEPCDEQGGDGAEEHHDEEHTVAQPVAEHTTDHAREHHTKIHDARGEGIVGHLVLARCHLLHHKQRQPYETKTIAEILQYDTTSDEPQTVGLVDGQQGVGHEGDVEDERQREERFLQSAVGDIVARQDAADDEGRGTERAVAEAYLLL